MANAIINVGQTGGQVNISTATAPATPAVGVVTLYAGTDKALHVKNSDGTDITIAAATAGATGALQVGSGITSSLQVVKDAAGTTGALRISTVDVTNNGRGNFPNSTVFGELSLCSNSSDGLNTAFGYKVLEKLTTGTNNLGIGNCVACCITTQQYNIAIGNCALQQQKGNFNTGVGVAALQSGSAGNESTAIGYFALGIQNNNGACNTAVGSCSLSRVTSGSFNTSVGTCSLHCVVTGSRNTAIGYNAIFASDSQSDKIAVGSNITSSESCTISMGNSVTHFPGSTGSIVVGHNAKGGTGACNSVVIGNSSRTTAATSVVIGQASCSTAAGTVVIGASKSAPGPFDVNIGGCTTNSIVSTSGTNTIIGGQGNCILQGERSTIIGGYGSCINNTNGYATIIGSGNSCTTGSSFFSTIISSASAVVSGYSAMAVGAHVSTNCSDYSGLYSGCQNTICSGGVQNAILGGKANIINSSLIDTVIIGGNNITANVSNTVFVPNLRVTGQAASLTNAIGSTGGSVTLNWNNSNIQTLTLTSSITTLTKSNPIDGAVYTLFLTQGGSGGYTVDFGADVDWAGGTGPTLSTAIGATDAVSLVYIAGVTGYYGNANLNFS